MHASYRGLSYKSALDVWSSCERLVRLSRLLGSCGIRRQYYRSYCCSARPRYATTNREQRHQHPDEELYEPLHGLIVPTVTSNKIMKCFSARRGFTFVATP